MKTSVELTSLWVFQLVIRFLYGRYCQLRQCGFDCPLLIWKCQQNSSCIKINALVECVSSGFGGFCKKSNQRTLKPLNRSSFTCPKGEQHCCYHLSFRTSVQVTVAVFGWYFWNKRMTSTAENHHLLHFKYKRVANDCDNLCYLWISTGRDP